MKLPRSFRTSADGLANVRTAHQFLIAAALCCSMANGQVFVPLDQSATSAPSQRPQPTADPTKYIIKFAPGTSRAARADAAIQSGASVRFNYQNLDAIAITVPSLNTLSGLRNNPNVLGIYPDYQFSDGAKPAPPGQPTLNSVTPVSDSVINLVWTNGVGGDPPEYYEIDRCTGSGCSNFSLVATVPAPQTNYSDSGLSAATLYRYRVRSCITRGSTPCSPYSAPPVEATTSSAAPPTAPTGLSANAASPTQVDLTWLDNSGNEQGFQILRCTGSGCAPASQIADLPPDTTAYSDTGAIEDTLHRYQVVAYNTAGSSASTIAEEQTPPLSTGPIAPSNLAITSVSSSVIDISWADNSSDETDFEIERCTGASCGGFAFLASVGAGITTYSDSAVADDTTYGYRVRAVKSGEFSEYSNTAEGSTSPIAPPPPAETPITGGRRQKVPAGVQRVGPPGLLDDGVTPSDGAGTGIAVLDSGLDYAHEDLGLDSEVPGTNSYNGFLPGSSAQDDRGHGTHVAGVIAALNNNVGVVGVAPNATLYGVKVLGSDGSGDESIVTAGLDWVITNHNLVNPPIRIVNMSLGRVLGEGETVSDATPFHQAIQALYNLGIVVVASAGNEPTLETTEQVPSGYAEVLAVAGTVADPGQNGCPEAVFGPIPTVPADGAAIFTSDGQYVPGVGGVTTSAPSEERDDTLQTGVFTCSVAVNGIQSTTLGGGISRLIPAPEGPSEAVGTSFAAPHVSGVVARIMQTNPGIASADSAGVEAIRSEIRNTADRRETAPPDPTEPPPAPEDNPVATNLGLYTFDGEREGIAQAP